MGLVMVWSRPAPLRRAPLLAAVACAITIGAPATAHASQVQLVAEVLTFTADPGEKNDASIWSWKQDARVSDSANPLEAGPGCEAQPGNPHLVTCSGQIKRTFVDLGDGDDYIAFLGYNPEVRGGEGDDTLGSFSGGAPLNFYGEGGDDRISGDSAADTLDGGPGMDQIDGEGGDDTLLGGDGMDSLAGGEGSDTLKGQAGPDILEGAPWWNANDEGRDKLEGGPDNDTMSAGGAADTFSGGDGADTVSYLAADRPVHASLDGQANDGEEDENDLISTDVEGLTGGPADDVLVGDARNNVLAGWEGNDVLVGAIGSDLLFGDTGNDRLYGAWATLIPGGPSLDILSRDGGDSLSGGTGADVLDGAAGTDAFSGDEGPDAIESREPLGAPAAGGERVYCGHGADRVDADPVDALNGCEIVNGRDQGTPGPPRGAGGWRVEVPVGRFDGSFSSPTVAMTSDGDAVAIWTENSNELWSQTVPRGGEPAERELITDNLYNDFHSIYADNEGGATVLWYTRDGVDTAARPAGGPFSPIGAHRIEGCCWGKLAVNGHGDAAITWYEPAKERIVAVTREPGGAWGEPEVVVADVVDPGYYVNELSEQGDVYLAWHAISDNEIRFGGRAANGDLIPVEVLSTGGQVQVPELAHDDEGNVVAAWGDGPSQVPALAERPAGGEFGAPHLGLEGAGALLGMDGDGNITLAYEGPRGLTVASGKFGDELTVTRRFAHQHYGAGAGLAVSHNGRALLTWAADLNHWVSAQRAPGGEFGPVEDLRPSCDHTGGVTNVAVNDEGDAAAMIRERDDEFLAVGTPAEAPAHQECALAENYQDPDAPPANPGGGEPYYPSYPWIGFSPPPLPPGFSQFAAPRAPTSRLEVSGLRVSLRGSKAKARFKVFCSMRCVASASARLSGPSGAGARGKLKGRKVSKPRALSLQLRVRKPARTGRAARRGRVSLTLQVTAKFPDGTRRTVRKSVRVGARR
jgi:hypothetical protein